jgi:predicted nucleotide-binding protein (sugar kinase/HSP70/actin superfamily)
MDYATTHTMAAGISGLLDIDVTVLPSGEASHLEYGKRFSSGRECYPYIVTLADILTFFYKQKEQGEDLSNYILIYPQAHGPCRFGQYHTAIDIILEKEGFGDVVIVSPTTKDSYTLGGQITPEEGKALRIVIWNSIVAGDILNRLLWRTRPYEQEPGRTDQLYEEALDTLCKSIQEYVRDGTSVFSSYRPVIETLRQLAATFAAITDTSIPRKPLIGIAGEIYLRMHEPSNQHVIRKLESFGCETVTASLAEWVNYTTYMRIHDAVKRARRLRHRLSPQGAAPRIEWSALKEWLLYSVTKLYQYRRMRNMYAAVTDIVDIPRDHTIEHIFSSLDGDYDPELPGEAVLTIATVKTWLREQYHGALNVMPFGCMPGNNSDWILSTQSELQEHEFPYLSLIYDDTVNPTTEPLLAVFAEKAKRYQRSHEN